MLYSAGRLIQRRRKVGCPEIQLSVHCLFTCFSGTQAGPEGKQSYCTCSKAVQPGHRQLL